MHEEMGGGKEEKMSVLVKGMEMPKNCGGCPLRASCVHRIYLEYRPDYCPLIEIPPHGSLIDMDDFLQECSELESYRTAMKLCEVIEAEPCNDLAKPNNAPAIIEAEEVYNKYTDTTGKLHWTGTHSGEHIIPADGGE